MPVFQARLSDFGNCKLIAQEPAALGRNIFEDSWGALEAQKTRFEFRTSSLKVLVRLNRQDIPIENLTYKTDTTPKARLLAIPAAAHPLSLYQPVASWLCLDNISSTIFSMPGTGRTPMPGKFEFLSLRKLAQVSEGMLNRLQLTLPDDEGLIILAHSIGDLLTRFLLKRNSEKIRALVLINPMDDDAARRLTKMLADAHPSAMLRTLKGSCTPVYQNHDLTQEYLFSEQQAPADTKAFNARIGTLPFWTYIQTLLKRFPSNSQFSEVPVLVVSGKSDKAIPFKFQRNYAHDIRGLGGKVTQVEIENAPHDLILTQPERLASEISEWVDRGFR